MYDLTSQRVLAGAAGAGAKLYVEDVFSTWLYTGNNSTQSITNGIDLSGKGGLVWLKRRDAAFSNFLFDTARGASNWLTSNGTFGQVTDSSYVSGFTSSGFTLGNAPDVNANGGTYASWTFRKAAKFFDVVTYVGDADFEKVIPHNLGATPGCIIVKAVNDVGNWNVYHRSTSTDLLRLNLTNASVAGAYWGTPTSTTFTVKGVTNTNAAGTTYVAYLFAHDAGGFGDSGNDSVVKCGSFTGGTFVDLGWEPQWILMKTTGVADGWRMFDNMRALTASGTNEAMLQANSSSAESATGDQVDIAPTGFTPNSGIWGSFAGIYIAIRRGPMKTPTDATKVFAVTSTATASSPGATATTNFPVDLSLYALRNLAGLNSIFFDRLRGTSTTSSAQLTSSSTAAEATSSSNGIGIQSNTTVTENWTGGTGYTNILWNFRRAPGFFDVVAYTGDGNTSTTTVPHGLTVQPELMLFKGRNLVTGWDTYVPSNASNYFLVRLNNTGAQLVGNVLRANASSSTVLNVGWLSGNVNGINDPGYTYIAYLFASCPGVSKVGSYTGTGTTQQINCGFTSGARFVLIKRTDSTGDWYVWDSARGIVAGNDPYLLLNSTAAEVTGTDYVDTYSAGFEISSTAPAAINANGGSFIFFAVA